MLWKASLILLVTSSAIACADEFPQFRGVDGSGIVRDQKIPTSWSTDENMAWKIDLPGAGWSQPVIWGERLFVTTAVAENDLKPKGFEDGAKTPQSMGLGALTPAPNTNIDWQVLCYNSLTGELLWQRTIATGKPKYAIHPSNTYATESPVVDAQGIYVFFGATGAIAALSHAGEVMWKQELGVFPTSNSFGTGSSLAIFESKVIVQQLTEKSSGVTCFDALTGNTVWKHEREKSETSWSSPILWRNELRNELLVSGGERIESLDPNSGSKLWELTNVKAPTACSIAFDAKQIYFGGSDPFSKGPLFAVKSGASGSVAPKKKNAEFESMAWLEKQAGPGMASPVSSGEHVYVVDNNILRCYDAKTGERRYQTRLPKLKMVAACPLIVGDKLLVLDESGGSALVKLGPEFEVVGGGEIKDTFWATPAVANDAIYFRGVQGIYCIGQPNLRDN
jgi:outer membrane protein assembly factor BamB